MENNNKESFKLLGVSASGTDSGSEVPELVVAPPRKKRIKRLVLALGISTVHGGQIVLSDMLLNMYQTETIHIFSE
jgi:hypothetical protein